MEVETPILSDLSGGAVAKPFKTKLSAQNDRALSLRIAPELYLKTACDWWVWTCFRGGKTIQGRGHRRHSQSRIHQLQFYAAYTDLQKKLLCCLKGFLDTWDKFATLMDSIDFV